MARPKSKGALRTFIFTVDANDPKYSGLVEYLENIDNGARSYVIRQILNSYLCEQNPEMMKSTVSVNIAPVEKVEKNETIPTKQEIKKTENPPARKTSFKNKMNSTTVVSQETVVKEEKTEKVIPSEGMTKLLNQF